MKSKFCFSTILKGMLKQFVKVCIMLLCVSVDRWYVGIYIIDSHSEESLSPLNTAWGCSWNVCSQISENVIYAWNATDGKHRIGLALGKYMHENYFL